MTEPAVDVGLDLNLEANTRARMARWNIPGVVVGEINDATRAVAAMGAANLDTGFAVLPDTLLQIGSISKIYTATLVMMLIEEGALDLDTPIIAWLPNLRLADPVARDRLTLAMCLCHSGGFFGDYFEDFGQGDDALSRYIHHLDHLTQQTPVGASWAYNNAGFCLAGAVIEQVTGQVFERVMRSRIFEPLGLTRSFYFAQDAITYAVAAGHNQKTPGGDEHEVARPYALPRAVNAAGGIVSSMADLLTFAEFHLNGGVTRNDQRLLSEKTVRAMWEPRIAAANFAEAYGVGWETWTLDGERLVGHGGSTNGFNARLTLIPERHYAIAILTNSGRGLSMYREVIAERIAERFNLRAPEPPLVKMTQADLRRFAGVYHQPDGQVRLRATRHGLRREMAFRDVLTEKASVYPAEELRPIGAREFVVVTPGENEGSRIDFLLDEHGEPRFLRMGGRLNERSQ
jgi:CubicO group peptidase (beta-lactamase class C family)